MSNEKTVVLTADEVKEIKGIVSKHKSSNGALIPILHEVQEFYGYMPYEVQKLVAEEFGVPVSEVYGVVTFYSRFSLNPIGKYKIGVCLGTACYVKGSDKVLDKIQSKIGIHAGHTSEDGMFTLEATRCIGACGLAPVFTVNEDVYGKVTVEEVEEILKKYSE